MKSKLQLGLAVLVMGILAAVFFGGVASSDEIATALKGGALVIDVRSVIEFSGGHAAGAVNIPHDRIGREIAGVEPDTNRTIVVYCHSGSRSRSAKRALKSVGYENVLNAGTLRRMRRAAGE